MDQSASICAGETYSFDGKSLTASGAYSASYTSAAGCDSIINLTLEVLPAPTITISGRNMKDKLCVLRSNLGIRHLSGDSYQREWFVTPRLSWNSRSSNKRTSPSIGPFVYLRSFHLTDRTWNTTGNYTATFTSVAGCDSIVTLNLVVADLIQSTIKQQICEGQSYIRRQTTDDIRHLRIR